jgi:hypothetical protein
MDIPMPSEAMTANSLPCRPNDHGLAAVFAARLQFVFSLFCIRYFANESVFSVEF